MTIDRFKVIQAHNELIVKTDGSNDIMEIVKAAMILYGANQVKFNASTASYHLPLSAKNLFYNSRAKIINMSQERRKTNMQQVQTESIMYQVYSHLYEHTGLEQNILSIRIPDASKWAWIKPRPNKDAGPDNIPEQKNLNQLLMEKCCSRVSKKNNYQVHHISECFAFEAYERLYKSGKTCQLVAVNDKSNKFMVKLAKEEKEKTLAQKVGMQEYKEPIPKFIATLYPYQAKDVNFIVHNKGTAFLMNDMGTGKTITSLAGAMALGRDIIVICPKVLKKNWKDEISKFTDGYTTEVVKTGKSKIKKANAIILNYDLVTKQLENLINIIEENTRNGKEAPILICDESQNLANLVSKECKRTGKVLSYIMKTKSCLELKSHCSGTILLTGTPINTKILQLWNQLVCCNYAHKIAPNKKIFQARYSIGKETKFGWMELGVNDAAVMRYYMRGLVRRTHKNEVLKDLPAVTTKNVEIELPRKVMAEYEKIKSDLIGHIIEQKKKEGGIDFNKIEKMKLASRPLMLGELRKLVCLSKVDYVMEYLKIFKENEEPVVIFSSFRDPLRQLREKLGNKAALLVAGTSEKEKDEWLEGKRDILLIGTKKGGAGLNLQRACKMMFISDPWTAADKAQAIARCHRNGQKNPVTVYNILAVDTIDTHMCERLMKNMEKLAAVTNDNLTEAKELLVGDDIQDEIIQELIRKNML